MSAEQPVRNGQDNSTWQRTMALFDRLLESTAPETLLASETDTEVREAAARLWKHHLSADEEKFLEEPAGAEVPPVFSPGQVLLDRFAVERMLGRGGMGEVYQAVDHKLGEVVALKTIARTLSQSEPVRRRFVTEVQSARRITHPNVCRIHDLFEAGPTVFLSMSYMEGRPLSELLGSKELGRRQGLDIARQLCEGLFAAHQAGVIHGDFKPGNVLIVQPLRAVILDFGLARALRASEDDGGAESFRAGTVEYMAPELLAGGPTTIAGDIFAFGKVCRELVPRLKLWDECTREDPASRPASLEPVLKRLRGSSRRQWLGAAAATILAGQAAWMVFRGDPAARLEAGARLFVNGFQAPPKALPPARLVRSLIITALQQSPKVGAVADQDLLPALRRMMPGGGLPVEGDLLRGLITLQRASHWIDGMLTQLNGRLSLTLRLWRAADGGLLAQNSFHDMPSETSVAEASAVWMRRLAGESARSLQANPAAVVAYTSSVPEALQKYYEGMEHFAVGEMPQALPLLEEALRLDPRFAQAENARAMCLNSVRRHEEAMNSVERARDLAVNLPEREKAWVEAFYQELVQDPVKMIEATRQNLSYHESEPRFLRIHGQMLCWVGRAEESVPFLRKAVELAPQNDLLSNELTIAMCEAGEFEAGLLNYQATLQRGGQSPYLGRGAGLAYLGLERYEEADQEFERVPDDRNILQAGARVMRGETESAIALLRQELAAQRTAANPAAEHRANEFLCGTYYLTDRIDEARSCAAAMVPLPECPAMGLQLQCSAFWAARTGRDETLESAAKQSDRLAQRWPNGFTHAVSRHARALQSWRARKTGEAESLLLESLGSAFTIFSLFDLADLYTAEGQFALAEEYWRKFEAHRGTVLKLWFSGLVLYGWLNRGRAARARGDAAVAKLCASNVLKHWAGHPGTQLARTAQSLLPRP